LNGSAVAVNGSAVAVNGSAVAGATRIGIVCHGVCL
jgi:hypothetical protein